MDLAHLTKQMPLDMLRLSGPVNQALAQAQSTSRTASTGPVDRERLEREEIAKDFESIFVTQMLSEMKKSIGQWGFEQDNASQQIDDLFWTSLGQEAGRQGGIGLWKDIYRSMLPNEMPSTQALDTNL